MPVLIDDEVPRIFGKYDSDKNGTIDQQELKGALVDLGMVNLSDARVQQILDRYASESETLDLRRFEKLVGDLRRYERGVAAGGGSSPVSLKLEREAKTGRWHLGADLPYKKQVDKFYNHPTIVWSVASVIVANFLVNIAEKEVDPTGLKYPETWKSLDTAFNVVFLLELLVNMYGAGGPFKPFWGSPWNVFDFIIVLVGVVLMSGADLGNLNKLKLLRAFRVFRLFKRIKALNEIITTLLYSIPGVMNAFLILLIFFAIYAILAVELFHAFGAGGEYVTWDDTGNITVSSLTTRGYDNGWEYYGTFCRALFTLFQVFTGESWSEAIARPLLFGLYRANAAFVAFFFVSFIMITQIVLANVVVAVLLQNFDSGKPPDDPDDEQDPIDAGGFLDAPATPMPAERALLADKPADTPADRPADRPAPSRPPAKAAASEESVVRVEAKLDAVLKQLGTLQAAIDKCSADVATLHRSA